MIQVLLRSVLSLAIAMSFSLSNAHAQTFEYVSGDELVTVYIGKDQVFETRKHKDTGKFIGSKTTPRNPKRKVDPKRTPGDGDRDRKCDGKCRRNRGR